MKSKHSKQDVLLAISLSPGQSSSRTMKSKKAEQSSGLPIVPVGDFDPATLPELQRSGRRIFVNLDPAAGTVQFYLGPKDSSSLNENMTSDNSTSPDSGHIDHDPVTISMPDGTIVNASWIGEEYGLSWTDFIREFRSEATIETKLNTVTLLKADPAVFEIHFKFRRDGIITLPDQEGPDPGFTGMWRRLMLAWLWGDCTRDVDFKDAVMDYIIVQTNLPWKGFCFYPPKGITKLIYNNTVPGSALRRFIIDQYVRFGQPNWLDSPETHQLDKQFFIDLSKAFLHRGLATPHMLPDGRASNCVYHEHPADENLCYKIKQLHENIRQGCFRLT